ncbi:hypothetical protein SAMN04487912_10698 [Arthrobacter sp. cf158]|uniref:hypothetical protein n=1 Tax=Arthrobacter sp. cf158 TaxID=1761744 RepID=UPI000895DFC7|nr:hypothetical protein [Arthrobacter sp. cf158]SDW98272.1 hypothetical protein SAMN04487912_10698 [Arthrobacter sp. cf158]
MTQHLALTSSIDGQKVSRDRVLDWERTRALAVLKSLGAPASSRSGDVDVLRDRLLALKREQGPRELERRLEWKIRTAGVVTGLTSRRARGARVQSSIKIQSPVGSARGFAEWFNAQSALPDSDAMLAACPDHYVIGEDDLGRQKVIETTGGSPLPTRFYIDYQDVSSLTTPASSDYPLQVAGVARTAKGQAIGGVRHQFRDLHEGFEAWLTVEFPAGVPQSMVAGHRWHLGCEFGNWIEFQQLDS